MVKATSDHRTIMLLPATRSQVPPEPASCHAGHWMRVNAGHRFWLPSARSGRAQSKAATEKPLCAARGVVNGTLLVAMRSSGRLASIQRVEANLDLLVSIEVACVGCASLPVAARPLLTVGG